MLVLALEFSRIRAARLDRDGVILPIVTGVAAGRAVTRQPRRQGTAVAAPSKRKSEVRTRTTGQRGVQAGGGSEAAGGLVGLVTVWCEPISQCSTG